MIWFVVGVLVGMAITVLVLALVGANGPDYDE